MHDRMSRDERFERVALAIRLGWHKGSIYELSDMLRKVRDSLCVIIEIAQNRDDPRAKELISDEHFERGVIGNVESVAQEIEAIRRLPGIGAYTAGAIASLAFHLPVPAVDGNVFRIMHRLFARKATASTATKRQALESLTQSLNPKDHPGVFKEALMEFGAKICTPRNPLCETCPLQNFCKAYEQGKPENFPGKIELFG